MEERGQVEEPSAEEVEELIRKASVTAQFIKGSRVEPSSSDSQVFHRWLKRTIEAFFQKFGEEPALADVGQVIQDVLTKFHDTDTCRPSPKAGSRDLFPLSAAGYPGDLGPRHAAFLALIESLNSLNGVAPQARSSPTCDRVVKKLAEDVRQADFLEEKLPPIDFKQFFTTRGVDYSGDEIKLAMPLSWESLEPSLPAQVATLKLEDCCELGVRYYVDNFERYLVDPDDMVLGKPPKVMVDKGEWKKVASGLLSRGICGVMPVSQLFHVGDQPLLNGLFSVSKQEFKNGVELGRLIMNLRPLNSLCRSLVADTGTLPSVTNMSAFYLEEGQLLTMSSEDIRCFFYIYQVPKAWERYLGFAMEVDDELVPHQWKGQRCVLVSKVLPMGWINSVGVAQHLHRVVVRRCLHEQLPHIGGESEVRRDKPFTQHHHLFRIYLDNFDELKKVDAATAELIEGSTSELVHKLRGAYLEKGLPRHEGKTVSQSFQAEIQGAWVDGKKGIAMAKPSKIAKYVKLTLELLLRGRASQRELQVVGGGMVYLAMYRRPLLSGLNQIWKAIVHLDKRPNSLTPYGLAAASSSVRGDVPEQHDFCQVLTIGLFDGVGALRIAADVLNLPLAGHISIEKSPEARRTLESFFPDCVWVDDVELVTADMVSQWSLSYSMVSLVLVAGGPPCQGVSKLNCDRKGALKDARSSLFTHVPRIAELCRQHFPWAMVKTLAENVASMDWEDCQAMNDGYQLEPWFLDTATFGLAHRPRLYWFDWEIVEGSGVQILPGSDGRLPIQGEIVLSAEFQAKDFLEQGWTKNNAKPLPTFTCSRPSPVPLKRPAGLRDCQPHERQRWAEDLHRFPPYQYKDVHCLTDGKGNFRTASVSEREAILGFPVGFTKQCMGKSFHGSASHRDCRLSLLGNSWNIGAVAWILSCLFSWLGIIEPLSVQQIVDRLTPGKAGTLSTLLVRPPMGISTKTFAPSQRLVQKLMGLASLKGEDLLVQSQTEAPVKFHRLRQSVPAGLWRWRTVTGWCWNDTSEHINVLELRSVLTSVRWKAEQHKQVNVRFLHLVDNLVVLHALTRGRSSSRRMRRTLMRISSYLLAAGLQATWGYVDTHQNPADKPSRRRRVKTKWLKRKC
eukprot:Skav227992  [mRNA]  locus=scaffold390:150806:154332:- [translate_table: standard]